MEEGRGRRSGGRRDGLRGLAPLCTYSPKEANRRPPRSQQPPAASLSPLPENTPAAASLSLSPRSRIQIDDDVPLSPHPLSPSHSQRSPSRPHPAKLPPPPLSIPQPKPQPRRQPTPLPQPRCRRPPLLQPRALSHQRTAAAPTLSPSQAAQAAPRSATAVLYNHAHAVAYEGGVRGGERRGPSSASAVHGVYVPFLRLYLADLAASVAVASATDQRNDTCGAGGPFATASGELADAATVGKVGSMPSRRTITSTPPPAALEFTLSADDYRLMEEVCFCANAVVYHAIFLPANRAIVVKCLDLD
ncbi:uncharacterized protein [Aegilops tauschii subsp. strangulata]|uniref:uncharacterized protein n=1 Tax=Aegilops tauschii subsp. strangulata TaxID=200361 RepID=UPI003CC8550D